MVFVFDTAFWLFFPKRIQENVAVRFPNLSPGLERRAKSRSQFVTPVRKGESGPM